MLGAFGLLRWRSRPEGAEVQAAVNAGGGRLAERESPSAKQKVGACKEKWAVLPPIV